MMHSLDPSSERYALTEILRVRDARIAELELKQRVHESEKDLIRLEVTKAQIENRKLTARIAELEGMGPIGGKVRT